MTTVYKLFSVDEWLYVGITDAMTARLGQHANKPWFIHVTHATFEHYETREEARERERALIHEHQPRHNIQHREEPHVSKSVCLPSSLITAVEDEAREQGHNNFSRVLQQAVIEYLAQEAQEAA